MGKSRWGILGTAGIAQDKLIPALHASDQCELVAVASREEQKAIAYAKKNAIALAYGSYEQLLEDPTIDIVYLPLPNHLHVHWITEAIKAGKHVLCEKPLALKAEDVQHLIKLRDSSGLLIGEAYAIFHQNRLIGLKEHLQNNDFGPLQSIHGFFTLYNKNPHDIRNFYQDGGGALWDIGVYPITVGRWMAGEEPVEVACVMDHDPKLKVDHNTTGILRFASGAQMSFITGMQHPFHTSMTFLTDSKRIEVPNTFHSDTENPMAFEVYDDSRTAKAQIYQYEPMDQYQKECEQFAACAASGQPFIGSLEHTLANTNVINALFKAAKSGKFERV